MSARAAFWVGVMVGGVVMFLLTINTFHRILRKVRAELNSGSGGG